MLPYFVLLLIPAASALAERRAPIEQQRGTGPFRAFLVGIALLIGLRFQVGADWGTYQTQLDMMHYRSLAEAVTSTDFSYGLLVWLVSRAGGDIWMVNLVCGAILAVGLDVFCRAQSRPWLALTVAIPYLIVVVAMGYSRQAVAIGLAMLAMHQLASNRPLLIYVLLIAAAATFHKTAILLIPLAALVTRSSRWWNIAWIGVASIAAYFVLLRDRVDALTNIYVTREYDSSGAAIRVAMNAAAAVAYLLYRKRFNLAPRAARLCLILSGMSLLLIPALIVSPSSTVVDRLGLYLIPLQLIVLARLPDVAGQAVSTRQLWTFLIVAYSAAVQIVWFSFGSHARGWVPYQLYPVFS